MLHEIAKKHPEEYDLVSSWVFPAGSDEFKKACPDARKLGTKRIAGRTGLGFRCGGKGKLGQTTVGSGPVWIDQASGLILRVRPHRPPSDIEARRRRHVLHQATRRRQSGGC